MKRIAPALFAVVLSACHKDDVDVSSLQGNPFDTDHPVSSMLTIDSLWTEATIPGAVWQQDLAVQVDQDRFPSPTAYHVRCIDSDGDTILLYSWQHPDGQFLFENYQVTLGVNYCYDVQLMIGDDAAEGHAGQACLVAAQ